MRFIITALLLCTSVHAVTITVSPGQSISAAISGASAGDIVLVKPGNYGGFTLNKSVIVKSEVARGAKITSVLGASGVSVACSDCTLDGFYIDGGGIIASGSQTNTTPRNVQILNNHAYRANYLYKIIGSDWLVEGNTFQRVVGGSSGDADYGRMFGTGHVFRKNHLFGTSYGTGMDIVPNGPHTDGMQYFGNNGEKLQNILIEQNFITDIFQGFFFADERSVTDIRNVTIRDNVIWGQPLPNTGNMNGRPSWGICVGKNEGGTNVRLENNLIFNVANATGMRGGHVDSYVGKNMFINCGTNYNSYTGTIERAGDFTGDPRFLNQSLPLGIDGIPFTTDDGWQPTDPTAQGYGPRMVADVVDTEVGVYTIQTTTAGGQTGTTSLTVTVTDPAPVLAVVGPQAFQGLPGGSVVVRYTDLVTTPAPPPYTATVAAVGSQPAGWSVSATAQGFTVTFGAIGTAVYRVTFSTGDTVDFTVRSVEETLIVVPTINVSVERGKSIVIPWSDFHEAGAEIVRGTLTPIAVANGVSVRTTLNGVEVDAR